MTARAVPEWIGKRPESMPGQLVLLRLYAKQNGLCACGCGRVMNFERDVIDCDHKVPLIDGGENRETNLQLMLHEHHQVKTSGENIARGEERRHKSKAFSALRKSKMSGPGFHKAPPQRKASKPIPEKFPGDILGRQSARTE